MKTIEKMTDYLDLMNKKLKMNLIIYAKNG